MIQHRLALQIQHLINLRGAVFKAFINTLTAIQRMGGNLLQLLPLVGDHGADQFHILAQLIAAGDNNFIGAENFGIVVIKDILQQTG